MQVAYPRYLQRQKSSNCVLKTDIIVGLRFAFLSHLYIGRRLERTDAKETCNPYVYDCNDKDLGKMVKLVFKQFEF